MFCGKLEVSTILPNIGGEKFGKNLLKFKYFYRIFLCVFYIVQFWFEEGKFETTTKFDIQAVLPIGIFQIRT